MLSRDFTIDLRKLRVLQEVERTGTVSAAAENLHLTPSAVSQQVAGLAKDLGVPLLAKRGRGITLTGQARVVLRHADAVQAQLDRARADLIGYADGEVGEVRVGGLSTGIVALVAPALHRLRSSRPGLEVFVTEQEPDAAVAMLDAGELDVAVMADNVSAPLRSDPRYHRIDLLVDQMDLVLLDSHPLADPAGVALADFANETWVGGAPDDTCSQVAIGVCLAAGFRPNVRFHCKEWDAVAALVAAGAGVALIPRLAYPLRPAGLVCCPVLDLVASRTLFALVRAGMEDDPGVAAMLAELGRVAGA